MIQYLKMGIGAVAGALWGGVGYAVARHNDEAFDPRKFGKTIILGTVLGLLAYGAGYEVETVEQFSTVQTMTILVDKLWNLLSPTK